MKKVFKFPFVIAYADTDAGGIVYHGRYIEIAERARMNLIQSVFDNNLKGGFVVRSLQAEYKKPLFVGNSITVETAFIDCGNVSMNVEQKFIKDGEICAIINVKIAYVDTDMKLARIPDEYMKLFD